MKYNFLDDDMIDLTFDKDELDLFKYKKFYDYLSTKKEPKDFENLNVYNFLNIKDGLKLKKLYNSYYNKTLKIDLNVLEYLTEKYNLEEFDIQKLEPDGMFYLLNKKYDLVNIKKIIKDISEDKKNVYFFDGRIYTCSSFNLKDLFYDKNENCTLEKLLKNDNNITNINFEKSDKKPLKIYKKEKNEFIPIELKIKSRIPPLLSVA